MYQFTVSTSEQEELTDITSEVAAAIGSSGISSGLCHIFTPHTTCALTINENADPDVKADIIKGLKLVPNKGYAHCEGNSPAHIKSSLTGVSLTIFIEEGRLALGTWQGVYLCEFDGPRTRKVWVKLTADQ